DLVDVGALDLEVASERVADTRVEVGRGPVDHAADGGLGDVVAFGELADGHAERGLDGHSRLDAGGDDRLDPGHGIAYHEKSIAVQNELTGTHRHTTAICRHEPALSILLWCLRSKRGLTGRSGIGSRTSGAPRVGRRGGA